MPECPTCLAWFKTQAGLNGHRAHCEGPEMGAVRRTFEPPPDLPPPRAAHLTHEDFEALRRQLRDGR